MESLLTDIVLLFLLSIVVTMVCARVRLPSVVGFLFTGILCGPSLLGVVNDMKAIDTLAEIGVALLLFTIGMELSGSALARLKKPVFIGGSLQIFLTVGVVAVLHTVAQHGTWSSGIFFGCLVALSSSAIVLRLLQQSGSTATPAGRLTLAILVFQDIMVAPMLLGIPLLSGTLQLSWASVLTSLGQIAVALGGLLLFAHFGLDRLMAAVVRTRIRELLLLTTLSLCMGTALLTSELGLSLSLGAFLAGLLLARSEYSMSVVSVVLPYRDVFMSLFFISVGMLLDVGFLVSNLGTVTLNTLGFFVIKSLLILPAVLVQRYPLPTALMVSLMLTQVGEFSFVLAAHGLKAGLMGHRGYQVFLAMSIITMMLTPLLMYAAPRLAARLAHFLGHKGLDGSSEAASSLHNHLIIVGFGVSGKHLASVAREAGIQYEILEMNPETVSRYQEKEPIHYGDASQASVLEHLGIATARVMAIVISDPAAVRATIAEARALNPGLHIVARTRFLGEVEQISALGANAVVAEEFESSIEVFSRVLDHYLVPQQDIDAYISRVRAANYAMLRTSDSTGSTIKELWSTMPDMSMHALRLAGKSPLVGTSLMHCALRPRFGVTVVAVKRDDRVFPSPDGAFIFEAEDIVYLFGSQQSLRAAMELFSEPRPKATDDALPPGAPQPG